MEPIFFKNTSKLREWLTKNHDFTKELWLGYYKMKSPKYNFSWSESVDELICFGWIDGTRRKLDEKRTMQLITKRRVQHWSKTYKERVSKLIEQEKMHDAGLKSISISKS